MSEPNVQPTASSVAVKGPDGSLYKVPKAEMSKLPEGSTIATQDEVFKAESEEKYGGFGYGAAAAGLGLASGATFGLSNAAIRAAANATGHEQQATDFLKGVTTAHEGAYQAGELGSLALPFLGEVGALGKAAKVAEGASTLQRGVFGAGRLAEEVAGNVVGRDATSLAGRALQSGISKGAGAALEGSAFGAGNALSDAAINDHDLTAEKLWAEAGKGALLGGALGAAGGVVAKGMGGLATAALEKIRSGSIGEALEKASQEAAFRAAGPGKAIARSAERFSDDGFAGVGKIWRDEAPALAGKTSFATMTREDLGVAADKGLEREGERIGRVLDQADRMVPDALKPRVSDVLGDVESIAMGLDKRAGAGPAATKLRAFADDIKRITGAGDPAVASEARLTFRELRDFRRDADNIAFGAKLNPDLTGFKGQFSDLRDKLEARIKDALEETAKEGDKGLLREYESAKKQYQAFKLLGSATENQAASHGGNLGIHLTEKLAGHAVGVVGGALHGPVGFVAGELLGGAASRLIRHHGEFISSAVLQKLGGLAAAERMSAAVDTRIAEGIGDFFRGSRGHIVAPKRPSAEEAVRLGEQIRAMAQNPDALMSHVQGQIGPMDHAPRLAGALAAKAANDISYLAAHAPKVSVNVSSLTPKFEKQRYSPDSVQDFTNRLEAVKHPLSILDDMRKGTLSRAKVDAVKNTSPGIYNQIHNEIMEHAADLDKKLPYAKKLQLAILFQAPTDETLTPEFIAAMQKTTAPPAPEHGSPKQKGGGRRPIDLSADDYAPETSQIAGPK